MKMTCRIKTCFAAVGLAAGLASNVFASDDGKPSMALKIHFPADVLSITHADTIPFWYAPVGIQPLTEKSLANTLGLLAKVRDETGEVVGIATEHEVIGAAMGPNGKPATITYWLIFLPGRGSFFLYGNEQVPDDMWQIMETTIKTGQEWVGDRTWESTVGPLPNGRGRILSGDGEFASVKGSYTEMNGLVRFPADASLNGDMDILLYFEE